MDAGADENKVIPRPNLTLLLKQPKNALLDTPGFNDTPMGDTEATADICAWTLLNYRGRPLSGIIYLNRTVNALAGSSFPKNP